MCPSPSSIRFPAAGIMCLHPYVLDWLSHCLRFVYPHLSYLPSRQVIFSPCASIPSFFYSLGSFSAWQSDFCYHWDFQSPSLFFDFLPKHRCPIISNVSGLLLRLRPQITIKHKENLQLNEPSCRWSLPSFVSTAFYLFYIKEVWSCMSTKF